MSLGVGGKLCQQRTAKYNDVFPSLHPGKDVEAQTHDGQRAPRFRGETFEFVPTILIQTELNEALGSRKSKAGL